MSESRGNNPNIDPADNDTLVGTLRFVFNQLTRNVDGMLPARVLAYDRTANRVQVQLMIAMVSTSGAQVSRAQIANIPVINFGGGGYILNFPLTAGDLGFVMANDRDISLFLQSYEESPPNTLRVKSFSDAVFIPSVLSTYTTTGQDGNAVLQNLDGTVRISLGSDNVAINVINGSNTFNISVGSGEITLTSPTSITLDSPLTHVTGTLQIDGGATIAGSLAAFPGYSVFLTGGNLYTTGFIKASGAITPSSPP